MKRACKSNAKEHETTFGGAGMLEFLVTVKKTNYIHVKAVKNIFVIVAVGFGLFSCVKEPLYNTDHPDHGRISLTTDWTDRGEDIDIPDNYSLKLGDYTTTLSGTTNEINNYFLAGSYHINIWNTASNILVAGNTATAGYGAEPGWFFTGSLDLVVENDRDHAFTVPMRQQVRRLTLVLEVTGSAKDKITAIDATLSGMAGAIDIDNGNPVGNAVTLSPVFGKQADGKYSAVIRLLGITGNAQTLTLALSFSDGNSPGITTSCDLSDQLADFNIDKKTPLSLRSLLLVTPSESGFSATISEWTVNTGSAIAD
jgi:hypothetical protein